MTLLLQASLARWAGRDCEEGATKQVPSLKPSEGRPSVGRGPGKSAEGPIKASRGPLDAAHVQEQSPHMHVQVSHSASSGSAGFVHALRIFAAMQHRASACSTVSSACCCCMLLIADFLAYTEISDECDSSYTQQISLVWLTLSVAKCIRPMARYIFQAIACFFLALLFLMPGLKHVDPF